jgi:hypothetical protein
MTCALACIGRLLRRELPRLVPAQGAVQRVCNAYLLHQSSSHAVGEWRTLDSVSSFQNSQLRCPIRASMVSLASLTPGYRKARKRRCRGGGDKQAGRGHKGQKSRSGAHPEKRRVL